MRSELTGTVQFECEDDGEYIGQAASALENMISERQSRHQVGIFHTLFLSQTKTT